MGDYFYGGPCNSSTGGADGGAQTKVTYWSKARVAAARAAAARAAAKKHRAEHEPYFSLSGEGEVNSTVWYSGTVFGQPFGFLGDTLDTQLGPGPNGGRVSDYIDACTEGATVGLIVTAFGPDELTFGAAAVLGSVAGCGSGIVAVELSTESPELEDIWDSVDVVHSIWELAGD